MANTLECQNTDDAEKYWLEYVELKAYDKDGWESLYYFYSENEDREKLYEVLERMVELDPSNSFYAMVLLKAYHNVGHIPICL